MIGAIGKLSPVAVAAFKDLRVLKSDDVPATIHLLKTVTITAQVFLLMLKSATMKNSAKKKRKSVTQFATNKCSLFSEKLPELDRRGSGLQAPHEVERPWTACAVFCRRKDTASYYTPRIELNDLGLDPYFPDGTWCHREKGQDYFCQQHHCLPENF